MVQDGWAVSFVDLAEPRRRAARAPPSEALPLFYGQWRKGRHLCRITPAEVIAHLDGLLAEARVAA